jgi:murein DD-endopeptidase MepM/ murein hydrolase activator NlpD
MSDSQETYTVVILPRPTAKGFQFRIAKRTARWVVGGCAALGVLALGLAVHYAVIVTQVAELEMLRSTQQAQQAELDRYNDLVTELNGQLDTLREFDVKLRVMTDLNPPPEGDDEIGIGGTESMPDVPRMDGKGGREEPLLMTGTETALLNLQAEAARQAASFADLVEGLGERMDQWAATPSIRPVRGWLSSGFGKRLSPFTGTIMMHKGIDLATYIGTPIVAPANGRIEYSGIDSGLGQVVVIDHGHGIKTLFGHLSKSFVRVGQRVERGEAIAAVGNSGLSTGSHLHYEVRVNGRAVDPLRYIIN